MALLLLASDASSLALVADRGRIVQQEVAWSAGGVIGISDLSSGWASCISAATLAILAVRQRGLIVGSTTLPANAAWTTTNRSIAAVAITVVVQTASADQQRTDHTQEHHCAFHLRHPLRDPSCVPCGSAELGHIRGSALRVRTRLPMIWVAFTADDRNNHQAHSSTGLSLSRATPTRPVYRRPRSQHRPFSLEGPSKEGYLHKRWAFYLMV